MAYVAGETGDKPRQKDLNLQAAQALAQCRAYSDLFTVLGNLGGADETEGSSYLAQALWIALRLQIPLQDVMNLIRYLFNQIPRQDPLEPLLAATALILCARRGQDHPQIGSLQEQGWRMMSAAAASRSITQEDFEQWFFSLKLNDPSVVLPAVQQALETLIGDTWLFDPAAIGS